jgi:hypothetical protein
MGLGLANRKMGFQWSIDASSDAVRPRSGRLTLCSTILFPPRRAGFFPGDHGLGWQKARHLDGIAALVEGVTIQDALVHHRQALAWGAAGVHAAAADLDGVGGQ